MLAGDLSAVEHALAAAASAAPPSARTADSISEDLTQPDEEDAIEGTDGEVVGPAPVPVAAGKATKRPFSKTGGWAGGRRCERRGRCV